MTVTCSYVHQMIKDGLPAEAVVSVPETKADLCIPNLSGYCAMFFWEKQGVISFGGEQAVTHMSYRGTVYTVGEYIEILYNSEHHQRHSYIREYVDNKITKELEFALDI